MSAVTSHTVAVEPLRTIPGHERVHPAVTAVVERSGSHVKVCVTSRPVRGYEGSDLPEFTRRQHRTVAAAMDAIAVGVAHTYGATFIPAVTR